MYQVKFEDYGYANARVRAMKVALLGKDFYEQLIQIDEPAVLLSTLEKTVYQEDVREVMLRGGAAGEIIDEALKRNLSRTFTKVTTFVAEEAKRLVNVLLSRWDLHNLKTILRGKHIGASVEEIIESLVPAGELNEGQLNELAKQADLKTFTDLLATWQVPYARPLLNELPKYLTKKDLTVLELALDKFHYARMLSRSEGRSLHSRLVHQLAINEIDVNNIVTLLRLQGVKFEFQAKKIEAKKEDVELSNFISKLLSRILGKKEKPKVTEDIDLENLLTLFRLQGIKFELKGTKREIEWQIKNQIEVHFIPGGKEITLKKFVELAQKHSIEELIKGLEDTSYGAVLKKVLPRYQQARDFSILDKKKLEKFKEDVEKESQEQIKKQIKEQEEQIKTQIKEQIETLFIPGGKEITLKQFVNLAQKNDVEALVKGLENTSYGPVLKKVLARYRETGSLSALERRLEENLVEKAINMYNKGALCIGIIIGYFWMKFNEIVNLRIISHCKSRGVPERKIREELILV